MKRRYRLLTGPDSPDFCQKISDALAEGYQLYGSPTMTTVGDTVFLGQAVIWPENRMHELEAAPASPFS